MSMCYIHFARVKGVLSMTRMKKKNEKRKKTPLTGSKTSTVQALRPIIYGNNYNKINSGNTFSKVLHCM